MKENMSLINPDFDEALYEIKITVKRNCSSFEVNILKPGFETPYGDIVGYLEITKHKLIWEQTALNIEEYVKRTRLQIAEIKKLKKLKKDDGLCEICSKPREKDGRSDQLCNECWGKI